MSDPLYEQRITITDSDTEEVSFSLLQHVDEDGQFIELFIGSSYLYDSIYSEDMPRNELIKLRDFLSEFLERTQ